MVNKAEVQLSTVQIALNLDVMIINRNGDPVDYDGIRAAIVQNVIEKFALPEDGHVFRIEGSTNTSVHNVNFGKVTVLEEIFK
ncbi:hypothetical protein [Ewingella americana]|uniref:Uncharacterized protein n=1 Tax=Ewingella americana TaxID=41202 RepID=A0A502GGD7_9GAMM|nr:hypothetical protein [Ewingella americana]TPG60026.1 hypothetical protein EAH77_15780 [Ewingella americana]